MTDKSKVKAANANAAISEAAQNKNLTGLFNEMQALMAVMPGAAFDTSIKLSTEEETEAMFDNMPV